MVSYSRVGRSMRAFTDRDISIRRNVARGRTLMECIPRVVFLSKIADYGVDTFRLTEEQFERETRLA